MIPAVARRPDQDIRRLQRLELVATVPIVRSGLDPTTGSGDVIIEYQGRQLTTAVLLEPEFVRRDRVKAYLALASNDHGPAPANAPPGLQVLGGHKVRFVARILGIVEVMANQGSPFASCLADVGGGMTLLLELPRVQRVAFQDIVAGSGDLVLRRAG